MDAEGLIGSIIGGALTGRRKRGNGALRYLTGGRGSFLNASTLLTVAGVAWGLYESAQARPTVPGSAEPAPASPTPPLPFPPPLPGTAGASGSTDEVPPAIRRLVQLTLSAARADGVLSDAERAGVLRHARAVGAEALVAEELERIRPIGEIVSGATALQLKQDLYTLAFSIVRADEGISGAERIYLAQLAAELGLDADLSSKLEQEAAAGIERAGAEAETSDASSERKPAD